MKRNTENTDPVNPESGGNLATTSEHQLNNGATDKSDLGSTALGGLDLGKFRISQEHFGSSTGPKVITTVPVSKPPKDRFFKTHPDTGYRVAMGCIELPTTNEVYLVAGNLFADLEVEQTFQYRLLVTAVTRNGSVYLWPIKADPDNPWSRSAHEIAEISKSKWVRLSSNREVGAYEAIEAICQEGEPTWPTLSFAELLAIAFKGRIIETLDHPVPRALRGEI